MQTIRVLVKGKVQGVFYRASAKKQADLLGVKGWVKNTPEGNVEIIATANAENELNQFLAWCSTGPSRAVVSSLEKQILPVELFKDFSIQR